MASCERRLVPSGVTGRRLDLDNIHSQVTQEFAAERAHRRSQIENSVAG
jgi:hypothetical protein